MSESSPPHESPPPTSPPPDAFGLTPWPADPVERAAAAASAGLRLPGSSSTGGALAELVAADPEPRVRTAALGALARFPHPPADAWLTSAADPDPSVRRRAADLAPAFATAPQEALGDGDKEEARRADADQGGGEGKEAPNSPDGIAIAIGLVALLVDREPGVAEAAAWALGELGTLAVEAGAIECLVGAAEAHDDPLVREAAVAALGSLGDPAGLDAVLAGCRDKPAIRRRAVLALAAFDGPEVDAALRAALGDKDWQTRQAAEDLLAP